MKILITGGAGFIGSSLALALIARGHVITALDNLSEQIHGKDAENTSELFLRIKDKVTFVKGDVSNETDLKKVLPEQEVIVHLAAETGTGQSMYQIRKYTDVNIGATSLMLDLLANNKYDVKRIVIASSRAIYGEGRYLSKKYGYVYPESRSRERLVAGKFEVSWLDDEELQLVATDEQSKIHPTSVYGITKQVQEQMVMTVCPTIGIEPVAFRYQNVYGPGQSLKNPYTGILSIFSNLIKNNQPINIFEDGKESRDFVFIDDVVNATVAGIEKAEAKNNVFNVGTGIPTTVMEVAQTLIDSYGINVPLNISGDFRLGDIRHNYAELKLAEQKLGFKPKVSFKEGIQQFTNWVNQQEVALIDYKGSLQEMKSKGLMK
ncbi:MAG: NAD-dependent epimerase/dehydratase family protein [Sphingobacteriales bacterium]|nr:NAD-dependent epimerase/dehydratase family protein [Sphingobacteriales bacterium]MBI3719676.1 NAD-dependent epimerase/dehydratase family protein [Sphingobacteriales bacterium]